MSQYSWFFVNKNYLIFAILATVLVIPVAYVSANTIFQANVADAEEDGVNGFEMNNPKSVATWTNGTNNYAVVVAFDDGDGITVVNLHDPFAVSAQNEFKNDPVGVTNIKNGGPQLEGAMQVALFTNTTTGGVDRTTTLAAVVSSVDDAFNVIDLGDPLGTLWNIGNVTTNTLPSSNPRGPAALDGAHDVAIFTNQTKVTAAAALTSGHLAIVASYEDDAVQIINLRDVVDEGPQAHLNLTAAGTGGAASMLERDRYPLDGAIAVDVFYVQEAGQQFSGVAIADTKRHIPYAIVAGHLSDGIQILSLRDPLNTTGTGPTAGQAGRSGGLHAPYNGTGVSPYANTTDAATSRVTGYNLLNGVMDVATWNTTNTQPYAIVVSNLDDAMIIIDLKDPTTLIGKQLFNSTDSNYFTALDGANSVETFKMGDRFYALITANATNASGVTLVDLYEPSRPIPVDTIFDEQADDISGKTFNKLDLVNGIATFYHDGAHYAIAASSNQIKGGDGDNGFQVIKLTHEKSSSGQGLKCGISRDCEAPTITSSEDGIAINGKILDNASKYNDVDTTDAKVGQLVTITTKAEDTYNINGIEKQNLYFDMPNADWIGASASIKYLVQQDKIEVEDGNDVFTADVSSTISDGKLVITYKIMFTGPMDLSTIGVQTIDSASNYQLVYFRDAIEVTGTPTQTAAEETVEGEVVQTATATVPEWVKNTAAWWAEGAISEGEFVKGVEFLINEQIIDTTAQTVTSEGTGASVPEWVKNTAAWWAEGAISENEFVNAIEHLVKTGTIIII